MGRLRLIWFGCILIPSLALGQAAHPPTESVTVTGTKSREVLEKFVGSLATPARYTGKMARWGGSICPVTVGVPTAFVTFINNRLKEIAVQAGWRRCFEVAGRRYEIQHYEHSAAELDEMASSAGLRVDWRVAARLAEPERPFFVQAGREYAFETASQIPAVLSTCWSKS